MESKISLKGDEPQLCFFREGCQGAKALRVEPLRECNPKPYTLNRFRAAFESTVHKERVVSSMYIGVKRFHRHLPRGSIYATIMELGRQSHHKEWSFGT